MQAAKAGTILFVGFGQTLHKLGNGMSWEPRGRKGRRYYYQAVWTDGKVEKRYLGTGIEAARAAQAVEDRRNKRITDKAEVIEMQSLLSDPEQRTQDVRLLARDLLHAKLYSLGCYQASYVWRRRKRKQVRK